jgi:fibronectin-binding autotransporter adhesin
MHFVHWLQRLASRALLRRPAPRRSLRRGPTGDVSRLLLVERLEERAMLANFVVDTADDNQIPDTKTTLREAIVAANASGGDDTITFDASLAGTPIVLDGTQLPTITGNVVITGLGAPLSTVDAGGQSRVLQVASSATVEIVGLTITGGNTNASGGGILNLGTLIVADSTIAGNDANIGGGIGNTGGTLTIRNSTLSNNSAVVDGGGVDNSVSGTLTITNSTISGNDAGSDGGGVSVFSGTAVLAHTTIVGNRSDANANGGGNDVGGGLHTGIGTTTLLNSIVVGNVRGADGADTPDDVGGKNLEPGSTGNVVGDANTAGGLTDGGDNTVGVAPIDVVDPLLAFNGGPTRTHDLVANSPARDRGFVGNLDGETTDQRGTIFARHVGANPDAGAVEFQTLATLTVDDVSDVDDGDYSAGQLTLREALHLNNVSNLGIDTIRFAAALAGRTIVLDGTQLPIVADDVTVNGLGANRLTVSGNGQSRVFEIGSGATVEIAGLTITGGNTTGSGGGVWNQGGNLTLSRVAVAANTAGSGGGVASRDGGLLSIDASTISGNVATLGNGGGILTESETSISNSTISGNSSTRSGGGVHVLTGSTDVSSTTIFGNRADSDGNDSGTGGGLSTEAGASTTLTNTIVAGNLRGTGAGTPDDIGGENVTADSTSNLIGDPATAGGLTNGQLLNVVGGTINLAPLADNGGPTRTHLPLAGSDAIDRGMSGETVDQIGRPRFLGGAEDIGAVEVGLVVDTTADVDDGDYSAGNLSLREAIDLANRRAGAQTITFDGTIFPAGTATTIALDGTEIFVRDSVNVVGLGLDRVRIDARNLSRHFSVSRAVAAISGVNLVRGSANIGGSILVFGDGELQLRDARLDGNNAVNGGAIFSAGTARVDVLDSTLRFNNASNRGGAIIGGEGSVITIRNSTLFANTATRGGGLYEVLSTRVEFVNSTISRNTAVHGGGINARAGLLILRHTSVLNNRSTGTGGGLLLQTQVQSIFSHSLFIGNRNLNGAGDADIVGIVQFDNTVARLSAFNIVGTANFTGGIEHGRAGNQTGFFILQVVDSIARNNGGPTLTHRLVAGGPAVDVSTPNANTPATDQRGFARVVNGLLDVGSLELELV